jgi:hypothetical protein
MSSTGLEDELRAGMARVPAQVPAGLARTAYRRYRRRRSTARVVTAAGTAAIAAGAAIGVGLIRPPGTAGPGQTPSAAYVVDRVTQAVDALPPDSIIFMRDTFQPASPQDTLQDTWAAGNEFRTETFTAAGQPVTEFGSATAHNRIMQTQVNYQDRTWSRSVTVLPHGSPSPGPSPSSSCAGAGFLPGPVPSATPSANAGTSGADVFVTGYLLAIGQPGPMVAQIRTALSCGKLKVAGNGDIDGIRCIKLVEQETGITLTYWVSRSAYLPVRLVTQYTQWPGSEQDDFSWLPPTAANLALATVTIPPGYTRVTPAEQP